jgi:hypothetical protein
LKRGWRVGCCRNGEETAECPRKLGSHRIGETREADHEQQEKSATQQANQGFAEHALGSAGLANRERGAGSPREDLGGEPFLVTAAAARSLRLNPRTISRSPACLSLVDGRRGRRKRWTRGEWRQGFWGEEGF